eukprot:CAMPEP_0117688380 /NCGR_PEP_ID=MMETSP0804-20121206/23785_1 /TAXON_ID=1074897 /ORGANISM="Tetraselmis astigmatica, Strain CCMP880" /LENGTH=42 /DNA_ID= /DNA_START= /DNA_END= /DNA_ORIENTATION=
MSGEDGGCALQKCAYLPFRATRQAQQGNGPTAGSRLRPYVAR